MRRFRPLNSNQTFRGPTMSRNDRTQARGIRIVHGSHPWMISSEQRTIRGELGTHGLIIFIHLHQLGTQWLVHAIQCTLLNDERTRP